MNIEINPLTSGSNFLSYKPIRRLVFDVMQNSRMQIAIPGLIFSQIKNPTKREDKIILFFDKILHQLKKIFSPAYRKKFHQAINKIQVAWDNYKTNSATIKKKCSEFLVRKKKNTSVQIPSGSLPRICSDEARNIALKSIIKRWRLNINPEHIRQARLQLVNDLNSTIANANMQIVLIRDYHSYLAKRNELDLKIVDFRKKNPVTIFFNNLKDQVRNNEIEIESLQNQRTQLLKQITKCEVELDKSQINLNSLAVESQKLELQKDHFSNLRRKCIEFFTKYSDPCITKRLTLKSILLPKLLSYNQTKRFAPQPTIRPLKPKIIQATSSKSVMEKMFEDFHQYAHPDIATSFKLLFKKVDPSIFLNWKRSGDRFILELKQTLRIFVPSIKGVDPEGGAVFIIGQDKPILTMMFGTKGESIVYFGEEDSKRKNGLKCYVNPHRFGANSPLYTNIKSIAISNKNSKDCVIHGEAYKVGAWRDEKRSKKIIDLQSKWAEGEIIQDEKTKIK